MLGCFVLKLNLRLVLSGNFKLLVNCLRLLLNVSEKQVLVQTVNVCQAVLTVQMVGTAVVVTT